MTATLAMVMWLAAAGAPSTPDAGEMAPRAHSVVFMQVAFDTGNVRLYLDPKCLREHDDCDTLTGRMPDGTVVHFHSPADLAKAIPPIKSAQQATELFNFVRAHPRWFGAAGNWATCKFLTLAADGKLHIPRDGNFDSNKDVIKVADPSAVTPRGGTFVIERPQLCGRCKMNAVINQFIIGGQAGFEVKGRPLNNHSYYRPCRVD